MTAYEIPLSAQPQKFHITLSGAEYVLVVRWCEPNGSWVVDFYTANDVPLLRGVPMITGVDLLEPYAYMNFNGQLVCQTDGELNAVPGYDELGTKSHLFWLVAQ